MASAAGALVADQSWLEDRLLMADRDQATAPKRSISKIGSVRFREPARMLWRPGIPYLMAQECFGCM